MVGCNNRLDTIQDAVLRIKLRKLDQYCDARRAVADYYDQAFKDLPGVKVPFRAPYSRHVFHQYTLQLEGYNRDKLIQLLADKGIPSMLYYPVPSHKQNMFRNLGGSEYQLPVTDFLQERVLSLPIHTEFTEEELNYITTNFIEAAAQARN